LLGGLRLRMIVSTKFLVDTWTLSTTVCGGGGARIAPSSRRRSCRPAASRAYSIAAVALANGLNANLLRRWVVMTEEQMQPVESMATAHVALPRSTVDSRTFIPIPLERSAAATSQEITIELRRGATVVKVGWPLAAATECAGWLRELLR
jgi:transposase